MTFVLCFGLLWGLDTGDLWSQANEAYREGRYGDALASYEALLDQGVQNGKLHFNLGNAYYRTGHLGKAILHYCRARKFLPGDPDVENNLAVADAQRLDPPIEDEDEAFFKSFDQWARQVSYSYVFYLALAFLAAGGIASLIMVMRPQTGKWVGYLLVLGGVVGLLLMGVAFVQYEQLTRKDLGVLIAREVAVLAGPSTQETVTFTIHEGIRCRILDSTEGWYRIGLANGYNGWVPRASLEII